MQATSNLATTLRKSQGQQELGRGSSPLQNQAQAAGLQQPSAFHGLRVETTSTSPNGGRHDVMEHDQDSPDLGGHDMQDAMLDDEEEEEAEFSDDMSSSPSVPDEDIDFEHVYALHTFVATVEGQATVTKGDSLDLLDDSNSYWWLVRVLNTQGVGYIPAENIETPFERLARLNKHRNVDIAGVTQHDHMHGKGSAAAVALIRPPVHSNSAPRKQPSPADGPKAVGFTDPTYFDHSGNEYSDSQDEYSFDEEDESGMQVEQGAFSDEDEEEEDTRSEDSQDVHQAYNDSGDATITDAHQQQYDYHGEPQTAPIRPLQPKPGQPVRQTSDATVHPDRALSPSSSNAQQQQQQQDRRPFMDTVPLEDYVSQNQPAPLQIRKGPQRAPGNEAPGRASSEASAQAFDQQMQDTRKITLTPEIAMGSNNNNISGGPTRPLQPQPQQQQQQQSGLKRTPSQQQRQQQVQGQHSFSLPSAAEEDERMSTDSHGGRSTPPASASQNASPQKLKKHQKAESGSSNDTSFEDGSDSKSGGKRKKGMFSGLFGRKKDKDRKSNADEQQHQQQQQQGQQSSGPQRLFSPEPPIVKRSAPPSMSSIMPQSKNDLDDYLEPEAKQQQKVEAQQAMYNQYGIRRGPGDPINTFTPQGQRLAASAPSAPNSPPNLSPNMNQQQQQKPRRPGSLLGSPAIPGMEAPTLSVLRIFSGDSLPVEATFKTVLLNESTSTPELLKQALQRFRLPLDRLDDFHLSIREADGGSDQNLAQVDKPLVAFQELADAAHEAQMMLPSVKRSSVASISSVSSNVSTHPAIAKLPMNDFSDDSAVKLYLNCKAPAAKEPASSADSERDATAADADAASTTSSATALGPSAPASSPHDSLGASNYGTKFAVRLAIHAADLPEGFAFDPVSTAIVPRQIAEQRNSVQSADMDSARDKFLFFATGSTVAEVIETALERFGIPGGVVDGGDDVEDKLAKRRSINRVRYMLMQVDAHGSETRLHPSRKILDSYPQPPMFKQQMIPKEMRRRSAEAAQVIASPSDIQPSDPTFYLRCATPRGQRLPSSRSLDIMSSERPGMRRADTSEVSLYQTPSDELPLIDEQMPDQAAAAQPPLSRQDLISAQRAAARGHQTAMISAQRNNAQGGVDLTLRDRGTLRSSVIATNRNSKRYSFIDINGTETDVSELVEEEWSKPQNQTPSVESSRRSPSSQSQSTLTETASFQSALTSPSRDQLTFGEDEDAIAALRDAKFSIGDKPPSTADNDHLQEVARNRGVQSDRASADIDDRIERVLSRVRHSQDRPHSSQSHTRALAANSRPSSSSSRDSPRQHHKPLLANDEPGFRPGSRSQAVEVLGNNPGQQTPERSHAKQPSVSSSASDGTASSQYSNGLSNTINTSATTVSPGVSTRGRDASRASQRMVYPLDLGGVDHLLTILAHSAPRPIHKPVVLQDGAERLFGPDLEAHRQTLTDPGVRSWFDQSAGHLLDMEQRLDAVLDQLIH